MLISLCMIVKNEEKVLARCLDSVKGLVDEIIIVDTGSDDQTKDIARQYTNHVHEFKWINDFAAARNESLLHASGRWILVMDADEYVEPGNHELIREKLESTPATVPQCFLVKIMNFHGNYGESIYESTGTRLFTNHCGISYREPVHEQLTSLKGTIQYSAFPLTLFHSGYTTETVAEKNKNQRNMDILQSLDSLQKRRDPYFCFVLGNEYLNVGDLDNAYACYKQSIVRATKNTEWYAHLLNHLCQTALKTRHYKDAERYIQQGKRNWPNRADYHCLEGMLYESFGFYEKALSAFQMCLKIVERCNAAGQPYWIIQEEYGQRIPHQRSAEIARKRGDLHRLVHHLTAVLKLDRNHFASLRTLLRTLASHESTESVRAFLDKLYPLSNPKNAFILLQTSLAEGKAELASSYWQACEELRLPLEPADELAYYLLIKQQVPKKVEATLQKLAPSMALLASVVGRDSRYIALAGEAGELLTVVWSKLSGDESSKNAEVEPLQAEEYPLMTQLLAQLLSYGYFEEYDRILSQFIDGPLLQSLADELNERGYTDMAINLYRVLEDNDQLHGRGCKRLGLYDCLHGSKEHGLQLMGQALEKEPTVDLIGFILENDKGANSANFIRNYAKWIPERECPSFIKKS